MTTQTSSLRPNAGASPAASTSPTPEAPGPLHVDCAHTFTLPAPLAAVFPLFTPAGERRWAPGWDPHFRHPATEEPLPGAVFTTAADGHETIWVVLECDAAAGRARYARVTPGQRAGLVEVTCRQAPLPTQQAVDATGPAAVDSTAVTVRYQLTALSPSGRVALASFADEESYRQMIDGWRQRILEAGALDAAFGQP